MSKGQGVARCKRCVDGGSLQPSVHRTGLAEHQPVDYIGIRLSTGLALDEETVRELQGLAVTTAAQPQACYRVYFDGGCKPNPGTGGCGGGLYVHGNPPQPHPKCLQLFSLRLGHCTSNVAEYLGLIYGLRRAKKDTSRDLDVIGDSQLVICQMRGEYAVNDARLALLHEVAGGLAARFDHVNFYSVSRDENKEADELASEGIEMKLEGREDESRNFLVYYPSGCHHCVVTIGGTRALASNDIGTAMSDNLHLIDAAFLRQIPGGQAALRRLSALIRTPDGIVTDGGATPLYPGALNVLTARGKHGPRRAPGRRAQAPSCESALTHEFES